MLDFLSPSCPLCDLASPLHSPDRRKIDRKPLHIDLQRTCVVDTPSDGLPQVVDITCDYITFNSIM